MSCVASPLSTRVLGVTEIAAKVGLHKSSISRILATLEQERIVARDETTRKYSLGLGLIAVAGPLLANLDVRRISFPFLEELAQATGETAVLTIWDGAESVSVEQIPSVHQVKHTSVMGSRYNTALSASVQVFLAHEGAQTTRDLLESGGVVLPENSSDARDAYMQRLAEVRAPGYAANHGETSSDEVGVAAPIYDHRGSGRCLRHDCRALLPGLQGTAPRSGHGMHPRGTTDQHANGCPARIKPSLPKETTMFEPRNSHSFDYELHGGSTMRMQVHFVNDMKIACHHPDLGIAAGRE